MISTEQMKRCLIASKQPQDSFHCDDIVNQRLLQTNQQEQQALQQYLRLKGVANQQAFSPAAVLIPLVARQNAQGTSQWHIILTKRSSHLKHHAGEISFPGGRQEDSDTDLVQTALRETHEEIGINPQSVEIIGRLPRQKTISQYLVTPFVAIVSSADKLLIDKNEVESAFEVPLPFAINPSNQQRVKQRINERDFYFYVIQYQQHRIWGATARMLVNLSYRLNPSMANVMR